MCPQGSVETISCPSTNCRGPEYLYHRASPAKALRSTDRPVRVTYPYNCLPLPRASTSKPSSLRLGVSGIVEWRATGQLLVVLRKPALAGGKPQPGVHIVMFISWCSYRGVHIVVLRKPATCRRKTSTKWVQHDNSYAPLRDALCAPMRDASCASHRSPESGKPEPIGLTTPGMYLES